MREVCILLASYNGEKYLSQQIESILKQDESNWELWIRDDHSTDKTLEIIQSYVKLDSRIHHLPSKENVGVVKSFFTLLKEVPKEYAYYMFCDQDDVWIPEKISLTLSKMKAVETSDKLPTLIYSDLKVVNEDLHTIHNSMFDFQKVKPERNNLVELTVQNVVTGCTVMINQSLRCIFKDGDHVLMHDQWLGMMAAAFGRIDFVPEATILYRQHQSNQVGAQQSSWTFMLKKLFHLNKSVHLIQEGFLQATSFFETFEVLLNDQQKAFLKDYGAMQQMNVKKRIHFIKKYQLKKSTRIRTIVYQYLLIRKI